MEIEDSKGQHLTNNHGTPIQNDQNSLKAGPRGPTLLEDFLLREKITHFDHERIPERIVHARGSAAHGHFHVYKSQAEYTRAAFLQDPAVKTPVFVRFSTVAGSRGSTDMARDVRGFAVKFYTQEGNFDLVGNNIPVFFIQDAIKFPDLVHAVKPEPHHEMPQAASAHDTFWDFISLTPEAMHMIMWVMSDRAIPRSYRMMEGFGVHTFRLINAAGASHFVKFHWKPVLGTHAVLWDEALKISGFDPDFHRRDLWEAIEAGDFPEWELGFQIVKEEDEHKFDFDLLDPTKLIPEELVPVIKVGKLTLDRNPDNFFAETEQVAFHVGHVVSGIDFTNDPLIQGRLFSYTDTQLSRLGGPNFHEIPINRPHVPVHNNQRDGHMRQTINKGRSSYLPNTVGGGCPFQAGLSAGGFASFAEKLSGQKVRERGEKFFDHFSQARQFFISQTEIEQKHMIEALQFELSKVEMVPVRERMLYLLAQVDKDMAKSVGTALGLDVPKKLDSPMNHIVPADADPQKYQPKPILPNIVPSPALSMAKTVKSAKTLKVAVLAADGVDDAALAAIKKTLKDAGASAKIVAPHAGSLKTLQGKAEPVDFTLFSTHAVLFDALVIPGGAASVKALAADARTRTFVQETYQHLKPLAALGDAQKILTGLTKGVVLGEDADAVSALQKFVKILAEHRVWDR